MHLESLYRQRALMPLMKSLLISAAHNESRAFTQHVDPPASAASLWNDAPIAHPHADRALSHDCFLCKAMSSDIWRQRCFSRARDPLESAAEVFVYLKTA